MGLLIGQLITAPGSECCSEAASISYTSSSRKNFEPDDTNTKLVGSQLRGGRSCRGRLCLERYDEAASMSLPLRTVGWSAFICVLCRLDSLWLVSSQQALDPSED